MKEVALTFDDGPDPVWTPRVLEVLREVGVRATFFVVAPLATRYSGLVRRAAEAGHEVSLHCYRHVRHDGMTGAEILSDAGDGLRALRGLGFDARDWRVPWGVVTPGTERVAAELGVRLVGWTADTEDWRGSKAGGMLDFISPKVKAGGIVLMHDGIGPGATRTGCEETVRLVRPLVDLARSRGLSPVPVGEMPGSVPKGRPVGIQGV